MILYMISHMISTIKNAKKCAFPTLFVVKSCIFTEPKKSNQASLMLSITNSF